MTKLIKKVQSKKGFTLVEVIVVLVILAILAAVLIPSLTSYIDKANEKAVIAECRSVVVAAQTLVSESYGTSAPINPSEITTLSEVEGAFAVTYSDATHKVTKVVYTNKAKTITIEFNSTATPKYIKAASVVAVTNTITSA